MRQVQTVSPKAVGDRALNPGQKGRASLVGESLKPPLTAPTYHFRWDSAGRGKAGEDRDCTGALARECCVSRRAGASPYMVLR